MLQVALGPPPHDLAHQIRSRYVRVLWDRWRHAGARGPLSLIAVTMALPILIAALTWSALIGAAYELAVVFGLAMVFVAAPVWVGRQLRRGKPDEPTVIWCRDGDRWAFILLRRRRDGSWAAFNFLSTGGGIGGQLVSFGVAMADDRRTPIHLTTRGARLIRYYQGYGFTIDRRRRLFWPTAMTYVPSAPSASPTR